MSKFLKKRAFRHYERIITRTFIHNQKDLKKKFQEDYEALKDDLEAMNQSLKNIVSLLEKLVDDLKTLTRSKQALLVIRALLQGVIFFKASDYAEMIAKCLGAVDSVHKIHSLGRMKEIRTEILRNLREYHEIANSRPVKKLLKDFNSLSLCSSQKEAKSLLKDEDEDLDEVAFAFKISSPLKILSSFGLRIFDNFSQNKSNWNRVSSELATDVISEVKKFFQAPTEKIQKIESCISSVKYKIDLITNFMKSAEKI